MSPGKPSPQPAGNRKAAKGVARDASDPPADDLEGFFVDAVPAAKKKPGRASDRRRDRGQAPLGEGVPDTRASMRRAAVVRGTLTCARGPEEGQTVDLVDGEHAVGRARENAFVLKDIAASRKHLRIDVDERGCRLVDLGSGNGTRLNGRRVSEAELRHGDRIEVGGSVLIFADVDRPVPQLDQPDDAQARVIRAAEKLAAELSQRMRFADQPGNGAPGFEDAHVARTQHLPVVDKERLSAMRAEFRQNNGAQSKHEQLWSETNSQMRLDEVMASEQPERVARPATQRALQPPVAVVPMARPQQARTAPPPPPAADREDYDDEPSWMATALKSAVALVAVFGLVIFGINFYVARRGHSAPVDDASVAQQFQEQISRAADAALTKDWQRVSEATTQALLLKPADAEALRYQAQARTEIDVALRMRDTLQTPPPAPSAAPPPIAPPPPAAAPAREDVVPAAAQPAPPAPQSKPARRPVAKTAPLPRKQEQPAPPPPKRAGKKMSEDDAQSVFSDAIGMLRDADTDGGCRLLAKIAAQAPADSTWARKAASRMDKSCP